MQDDEDVNKENNELYIVYLWFLQKSISNIELITVISYMNNIVFQRGWG